MASTKYISFHDGQTHTKYENHEELEGIEKINKNSIQQLYDELNTEIAQRGGYQSIQHFSPTRLETRAENPIPPIGDEKRVLVQQFNKAMMTRPYITVGGKNEYNPNEEEWYQKKDKDKIETLIYDLKQGKTVPLNNVNLTTNNSTKAATGCNNVCTGTCSVTCGGTAAA